jgi:hypothetical protein
MTRNSIRVGTFVTTLTLVLASAQTTAEVTLPIRMRTFAVNMSNNLTGANGIIQIVLERWSTAEERVRLLETVPIHSCSPRSTSRMARAKARWRPSRRSGSTRRRT